MLTLDEAMPLITWQAVRFLQNHEMSYELADLVQEGVMVYFYKCLPTYREDSGVRFYTYLLDCCMKRFLSIYRMEMAHAGVLSIEEQSEQENTAVMQMVAPVELDCWNLSFSPELSGDAAKFLDYTLRGQYNGTVDHNKMNKTLVGKALGWRRSRVKQVRDEILEKVITADR